MITSSPQSLIRHPTHASLFQKLRKVTRHHALYVKPVRPPTKRRKFHSQLLHESVKSRHMRREKTLQKLPHRVPVRVLGTEPVHLHYVWQLFSCFQLLSSETFGLVQQPVYAVNHRDGVRVDFIRRKEQKAVWGEEREPRAEGGFIDSVLEQLQGS